MVTLVKCQSLHSKLTVRGQHCGAVDETAIYSISILYQKDGFEAWHLCFTPSNLQMHLGKQHELALGRGSLTLLWETQMQFWALAFREAPFCLLAAISEWKVDDPPPSLLLCLANKQIFKQIKQQKNGKQIHLERQHMTASERTSSC